MGSSADLPTVGEAGFLTEVVMVFDWVTPISG